MTADRFHDALTLLPADLVAQTDAKRRQKRKRIPWLRYGALAACCALVMAGSVCAAMLLTPKGETESLKASPAEAPALAAPQQEEAAAEEAAVSEAPANDLPAVVERSMNTSGTLHPGIGSILTVETPLNMHTTACFTSDPRVTLLTGAADWADYSSAEKNQRLLLEELKPLMEDYDDSWFLNHDLLLIALCGTTGGEVTAAGETDGTWEITIAPAPGGDTAGTHILLELEKGLIPDAQKVVLKYE